MRNTEARLDFGWAINRGMGFPGYFLIVADFIQMGQRTRAFRWAGTGFRVRVRLVLCATITDLDPLR